MHSAKVLDVIHTSFNRRVASSRLTLRSDRSICGGTALLRGAHQSTLPPMTLFLLQEFFERRCQD